ncbi:MAG TPA: S9 family peptidase [Thermoleophilia bacterium]|nr:S9 family peptidase [Thermoleophilia bacterium]
MTGMVPQDVYELTGVLDPRLSPDGAVVAYVVRRADEDANDYRSAIWLAAADGSEPPRQLTAGEKADADPRWSPDGARLAFTSNRAGKKAQLYVLPVAGGEPRKLTSLSEDVTQAVWSPDGKRIAFVARVRDAAYDEEDDKRRRPRRITRLQYKHDNVGWTVDRRQHLFVVPSDGSAAPMQLTDGDHEDHSPCWSPDGRTIAFVSARHPDWDLGLTDDVYLVDAAGDEPRRLTQGGGAIGGVGWLQDGRLAVVRYPGADDDPRHSKIGVVDAGTGEITLLTASLDRNCTTYPGLREPLWNDGELVFVVEDHGRVHVYAVAADGSGEPRVLVGGEREVTGLDVAGGRLVFTASEPTRTGELYDAGPAAGGEHPAAGVALTRHGEAFTAARELAKSEMFTAVSPDGSGVDAWIMRPAGYEEGKKYPTLLNIHGGPYAQYGETFFDEFQVYCGAGYAVVFSNPRGSSGSTEDWARAIRGPGDAGPGWGSVDYEDCMAVMDEAVRRYDFVDADRLGVMGGSYGGYMTSWIVAHTDRFKAAVSERAVNNFDSQWGSSDFGWDFKGYMEKYLFEDVDLYLKVSPATYAQDIHTPLLILHSEDDLRCPMEQAEHLFVTLRLLKRPVEFVRFPAESHELTRSGGPLHRVQRFELVLEWFDRHLKG